MPWVRISDYEPRDDDDEGESGSDDDAVNNLEVVPSDATGQTISNLLRTVKSGEFSFGGRADMLAAMPGLYVEGVGAIGLPLQPEQAQKLVAQCDQAPFGKGYKTIVDEHVRKSWQLNPSKVEIRNSQWQHSMDVLAVHIANRMGYDRIPLQCVLYKLLVYGEGGHFVQHQDTEKEDGMITTLVVQLPSTHEGGDLIVYQGEEEYRHGFGKADALPRTRATSRCTMRMQCTRWKK